MQTTFEAWAPWGPCAGSCGGTGVRQRIRGCHHKMMGFLEFSEECPLDGKETQTCVVSCHQTTPRMSTAIPDVWSEWGQFSACDKTCGGGVQIRHRLCGSGTCFGDSLESAACNDHQCPVPTTTSTNPRTPSAPSTTGIFHFITIKRR
ncbi:ectin-like [Crassostrea virginica]